MLNADANERFLGYPPEVRRLIKPNDFSALGHGVEQVEAVAL
ncbi:hypothetical protein [Rhizobium sp. SGZ-381]